MKKIILVMVVLMFAAPAVADVVVKAEQTGPNEVTISYDVNSLDANDVIRAFGVDITVDNGVTIVGISGYKVGESTAADKGYGIFPGSIDINETTGTVNDYGTPVGDPCQYPDTLPGLGSSGVSIEMGSLYVDDANAPDANGVLCVLGLDSGGAADCNLVIAGNTTRGEVVMEDVQAPAPGVLYIGCKVMFVPPCWTCPMQPFGDATGDGNVNIFDYLALKLAWGTNSDTSPHGTGSGEYNCCADFNQDGKVNIFDYLILKLNWGATGDSCADISCP